MRTVLRVLAVASLLVAILLLPGVPKNLPENMTAGQFTEHRGLQILIALALGAALALGGLWVAKRRLRHQPGRSADHFLDGVARWAVISAVVAALAEFLVASWLVTTYSGFPISAKDSFRIALPGMIPGLSFSCAFCCVIMYVLVSCLTHWGGTYAFWPRKGA